MCPSHGAAFLHARPLPALNGVKLVISDAKTQTETETWPERPAPNAYMSLTWAAGVHTRQPCWQARTAFRHPGPAAALGTGG